MPGDKKSIGYMERTEFGSRVSRRLRRSGHVPGVVYGRGADESRISVSEVEFLDVVGYSTGTGMITLTAPKMAPITAIVKDVQWDMLTDKPVHIDFLRVSADQMVSVPVHVHLENTPAGLVMGGVLEHILHELTVKVMAKDIPQVINVDVAKLMIGDSIHIRDLVLPEGLTVDMDSDLVIATVVSPTVAKAEAEAEEGAVEGESAAAEASSTETDGK
jgi:large subunit ribosomal protein L25